LPEQKDLVIGILGASGAMAGLLLIFSGFLFAESSSLPKTTEDAILDKLKRSGRYAMAPFCGFLITTLLSTIWLVCPMPSLFWSDFALFICLVVATGVYGVWASFR
jgi:hypothetical protein